MIAFLTSPLGLAALVAAVIAATLFLGETLRFVARLALVALIVGVVLYYLGWTPAKAFVNTTLEHMRRVI